MKFIFLAALSALFFVSLELLYKFTDCSSINPEIFVTIWFIISGIMALFYFIFKKYHTQKLSNQVIFYIVIMALLSLVGNISYWNACKYIKNPGIARTIYSGVLIILLSIISAVTFKKYLSYIQSISILLILLGITLLVMNSN